MVGAFGFVAKQQKSMRELTSDAPGIHGTGIALDPDRLVLLRDGSGAIAIANRLWSSLSQSLIAVSFSAHQLSA